MDASPSETTLIQQAQQGDAKAFGQLYERYADRIYRYLAFRLHDAMEAEDLTAETFIRALQHLAHYRPYGAPWGAWLFRIAHNVLIDHWRHSTRRQTLALENGATVANGIAARALHHVLTRADLERGIAQLTDLQQQAITLRFIAGCSIAETAHVMQRSEQAVKDLQHKALIALRKSLEQ